MESSEEPVPGFWVRIAQTQPWGSGIGASSFANMQCVFIPEFLCPQVQGLHAPEREQYDYSGVMEVYAGLGTSCFSLTPLLPHPQ